MKKVNKCVILLICLVCLLHCFVYQAVCLEYSADSPIGYKGNFYIQVGTTELGNCIIVLPNTYKFDYLSTYSDSLKLYNTMNSTLSGYVFTSNNNYPLRFTALNTAQYQTTSGYQTTWNDLTINSLVKTNGSILGENGIKVYNVSDSDKIIITLLTISLVSVFVISFLTFVFNHKRSDY